jgi:hypothetical protein
MLPHCHRILHQITCCTKLDFLPMPLCFCIPGGCRARGGIDPLSGKPNGLNIGACLLKKHTLEDKLRTVQEAENRAQAAVDSQLEEITAYLSATTLADRVSGPSSSSGGRLWSRVDGDEAIFPSHKPGNLSGSRTCRNRPEYNPGARSPQVPRSPSILRSRRDEIVSFLTDLQSEVEEFVIDVSSRLDNLAPPLLKEPPSPFLLHDCLDTLDCLKYRLSSITFNGPQSHSLKANISGHLDLAEAKLLGARCQWDNDVATNCMKQTPTYGVFYDTGMLLNILIIFA